MSKLTASNCSGVFPTTPRKTMKAFDALPYYTRRALSNSYFNWATQPILRAIDERHTGFCSDQVASNSIKNMDRQKLKNGSLSMEYAVMAETHDGRVSQLQAGFDSARSAEDYPVKLALWKRVWVAPVCAPTPDVKKEVSNREPTLPPKPWDWVAAGVPTANGNFHAYLVDATSRKIAAIWGKGKEKELIADHILSLVNAAFPPSAAVKALEEVRDLLDEHEVIEQGKWDAKAAHVYEKICAAIRQAQSMKPGEKR